ncbi:hypothetical protein E5D57_011954 [Metarhizium anisopliae]|nr:hypothetical protein E5D57_011954 [Metarhizium anisopliae]
MLFVRDFKLVGPKSPHCAIKFSGDSATQSVSQEEIHETLASLEEKNKVEMRKKEPLFKDSARDSFTSISFFSRQPQRQVEF